jgi:hypothetical protein
MTNPKGSDERGTNPSYLKDRDRSDFPRFDFVINSSFVIRHSDFVIFSSSVSSVVYMP